MESDCPAVKSLYPTAVALPAPGVHGVRLAATRTRELSDLSRTLKAGPGTEQTRQGLRSNVRTVP